MYLVDRPLDGFVYLPITSSLPLEFAVAESDRVYSKLPEDRSVKWGALYPRTVPG